MAAFFQKTSQKPAFMGILSGKVCAPIFCRGWISSRHYIYHHRTFFMDLKNITLKDVSLSNKLRISPSRRWLHAAAAITAHSGDSWVWGILLLLVWMTSSPGWSSLAAVLFAGIFITAVPVMILKFTLRRPRPEGEWGQIYRRSDPHSFPSGHAARTTMFALLVFLLGPPWLGGIFAVWAALVMVSRVGLGVHYFSDILFGIALGIFFGLVTCGAAALIPGEYLIYPGIFQ